MNNISEQSKAFESNIRLQIIASLYKSDLSYRQLKEICNCSDGNMATHLNKLIQFKCLAMLVNDESHKCTLIFTFTTNAFFAQTKIFVYGSF